VQQILLPNGTSIYEINPYETKFLYSEIFVEKNYLKQGAEIGDGSVILDAGANIGMFALYVLLNFAPSQIYCFEPAPHCLEALRANLAGWPERATIVAAALAEAERDAEFTY
jgi:predicted RNA methylase